MTTGQDTSSLLEFTEWVWLQGISDEDCHHQTYREYQRMGVWEYECMGEWVYGGMYQCG